MLSCSLTEDLAGNRLWNFMSFFVDFLSNKEVRVDSVPFKAFFWGGGYLPPSGQTLKMDKELEVID